MKMATEAVRRGAMAPEGQSRSVTESDPMEHAEPQHLPWDGDRGGSQGDGKGAPESEGRDGVRHVKCD